MNSFDGDTNEPGTAPETEQLLQPVPEDQRITVMLAAFEGWNDAGEAASDALRYLNKLWGGKKVASIDADEYYDFQFTRPTVRRTASGERKIKWPSTRIYKASAPGTNVDVIFIQGTEPSYKWRAYTAERLNLEASQYEGPVGIVGVLSEVSLLAGIPTVSLWAAVPHYVAQAPSPKAQLALLHRIEELLQVPLDTHELAEEADAWERGVDELATEDPEIAAYVRQLEEAKDTADLPEATGESIAREFERYLKRRGK